MPTQPVPVGKGSDLTPPGKQDVTPLLLCLVNAHLVPSVTKHVLLGWPGAEVSAAQVLPSTYL